MTVTVGGTLNTNTTTTNYFLLLNFERVTSQSEVGSVNQDATASFFAHNFESVLNQHFLSKQTEAILWGFIFWEVLGIMGGDKNKRIPELM